MVSLMISQLARQSGEERPTADTRDNPRTPPLGVPSETADREGEDGGENARFEEEDKREHSDTSFTMDANGGGDEDHDRGHEDEEYESGFRDHHEAGGRESSDCEEALPDGVPVRGFSAAYPCGFDGIFDEIRCDADLGPLVYVWVRGGGEYT
jgi:hypothetical protein